MTGTDNHDVIKAFHRLTDAAEAYVNRSPRVKRIQVERSSFWMPSPMPSSFFQSISSPKRPQANGRVNLRMIPADRY